MVSEDAFFGAGVGHLTCHRSVSKRPIQYFSGTLVRTQGKEEIWSKTLACFLTISGTGVLSLNQHVSDEIMAIFRFFAE